MNTVLLILLVVVVAVVSYRVPYLRWSPFSSYLGIMTRLPSGTICALTFDDGPDPEVTPHVLSVLAAHGCTATFFVMGSRVEAHPELVHQITDGGHEVAAHGYSHTRHMRMMPWAIVSDMRRSVKSIEDTIGVRPLRYRPPYGDANLVTYIAAKLMRIQIVLWSHTPGDWLPGATPESIAASLARARARDIVLLHDSDLYMARDGCVAGDALELALNGAGSGTVWRSIESALRADDVVELF